MSFEADEEILQDFLIEAGEILESMSEQLVALENDPENMDLLNGIFRGFHTVKGGAGFLNLKALVDICHITENIFDILRNGDRFADAELMDHILQSLDLINDMFDAVRAGEMPEDASPEFLQQLGTFAEKKSDSAEAPIEQSQPQNEVSEQELEQEFDALIEANSQAPIPANNAKAAEPAATTSTANTVQSSSASDDITDEEFESLLNELHGDGPVKTIDPVVATNPAGASDDISDEEFEALLDELHGQGKISTVETKPTTSPAASQTEAKKSDELIDDSEFEALLDELHGSGKGPASEISTAVPPSPSENKVDKAKSSKKEPAKTSPKTGVKPKPAAKSKPAAKAKPVAKAKPKKGTAIVTEATVRVDTKRLDDIMNMVGELVLARNRLKTVAAEIAGEDLNKAVSTLDIVTADLQGAVMKTRMQPIKKVFGRFPRVVRDLARSLKKEIGLTMVGEETDLDKNLVEALADPLVHLVRNSVDHGIEMPEERANAGKTRQGTITLSAAQEGDHIMLIIEDDGKGMDADILRGIAVEKGIMDKEQAARLTDTECYNLIFHAGFSTKKEISDISGRGVGMDVVKTKITQLNGSLDIESEMGKGTKILIKVPLTLAILPTLMVKIRDQAFAFPLTAVNEIFHLNLTKTHTVDGQLMIVVREKALPLFFLNEMLTHQYSNEQRERQGHVVLAQVGTQTVGFVVDSLVGQEEVVIKPLGKSLHGTPGMAGATITSDGKIALILDIPSLLKHYVG